MNKCVVLQVTTAEADVMLRGLDRLIAAEAGRNRDPIRPTPAEQAAQKIRSPSLATRWTKTGTDSGLAALPVAVRMMRRGWVKRRSYSEAFGVCSARSELLRATCRNGSLLPGSGCTIILVIVLAYGVLAEAGAAPGRIGLPQKFPETFPFTKP